MGEWTKVVTNPLGLAGFALFLLFMLAARAGRTRARRWISGVAVAAAVVALAGCLVLAYVQISKPPVPPLQHTTPAVSSQQQTNHVQQTTTGSGSPAIQGVQGNVTITFGQSAGKKKEQKPREENPNPSNK